MTDTAPGPRPTLVSVAAPDAARSTVDGLIVRVTCAGDLACLAGLDAERIAWVEVPFELAERPELDSFSVDVLLSDPQAQASQLYRLARLRDQALPRLTIPSQPGVGKAASVAMALHFPIRLMAFQPAAEQVGELREVLDRFLHDSHATEPVEPFHSALAALIHGARSTMFDVLERDPTFVRVEPPNDDLDSVEAALERLVQAGAECASCSAQQWCAGWFKRPDPAYDCAEVRLLFSDLEKAAKQLTDDLREAEDMLG